jgi:hypothetical protein
LLSIAGGVVLVGGAAAAMVAKMRRKSPEERERLRRETLNRTGRIIDGTVIDFAEVTNAKDATAPPVQLLIYQYDVSGVQYEASQDVTHLRQFVDVHSCRLGLPASVKYDPHHPQNSIVVAETWSGLRTTNSTAKFAAYTEKKAAPQKELFTK